MEVARSVWIFQEWFDISQDPFENFRNFFIFHKIPFIKPGYVSFKSSTSLRVYYTIWKISSCTSSFYHLKIKRVKSSFYIKDHLKDHKGKVDRSLESMVPVCSRLHGSLKIIQGKPIKVWKVWFQHVLAYIVYLCLAQIESGLLIFCY